jgi:hypothetical protein
MDEDLRHNNAEYGGVALQKLQPALARLLVDAGSDYYGAAPRQVGITAADRLQRVDKMIGLNGEVGRSSWASSLFPHESGPRF